jgi:hypothetical protein
MKQIKVAGFTTDTTPDARPAVCIFGEENTGTTRFGCTAPHDDGWIGWLALDKNSKATVEEMKVRDNLPVLVNKEPFLSHADAMKVALIDNPDEVKKIYTGAIRKVFDQAVALAAHPDVESVVIDRASQLFDMILFSHFGRRNQIESFQRGAPNQDMIDLINALSTKNLVLIHKSAEIWKDTGEVDKNGRKKQAPTGKFKPDGFNQVGRFVTAVVELSAKRGKVTGLEDKYRLKVVTCKGNTLLEGSDLAEYGVAGEEITWDNLMTVIRA